jgi:branched-chain amino acid transport system permease protein
LIQFAFAFVNGLTTGMAVFLVAAGITLIFGILRILNFAHGSFFMVGAYIVFTFVGTSTPSLDAFIAYSALAALIVGGLGYITDVIVLRRLRHLDEATTLIATFALLLVCNGVVQMIWGLDAHSVSPPDVLGSAVKFGILYIPAFSLFTIALGVLVFLTIDLVVTRLWVGKVIQAVAKDSWMASLLGINVPLVFTGIVVAAFALAGFAGGLLVPNQSLSPGLASSFLLQSFVIVIIGGIGNIGGAFAAAIILGVIESLNTVFLPHQPGLAIYVAMVGFLLWRPRGLLAQGTGEEVQISSGHHDSEQTEDPLPFPTSVKIGIALILAAAAFSLPLWANAGLLFLAGVTMIEALFALSWNLLYGFTGLAAFGHAAFFAIGAYFVGVFLKMAPEFPFLLILIASGLAGALAAYPVAFIAIRRTTGIALAILTLALGEILRMTVGYIALLGKDDGLIAIPRPTIGLFGLTVSLKSGPAYYVFLCVACATLALGLWWFVSSQYGRVLRSIRQDAIRAEFIGVDVRHHRTMAFTISGALAALAGGLSAPWTQIVTPETASYIHSTQPMLNSLLGGVGHFWGPTVGAVIFSGIGYFTRTLVGISEVVSGTILLLIVLGAPSGILGVASQLLASFRRATVRRGLKTRTLAMTEAVPP